MGTDKTGAEYRLSPAAQDDLDQIFEYTLHRWGLGQAIRYTRQLQIACAESALAPLRAQDCSHIRHGYRRQPAERHFIYFSVLLKNVFLMTRRRGRRPSACA